MQFKEFDEFSGEWIDSVKIIPQLAQYIATGGETIFQVTELKTNIVVMAFRSGLAKVITTSATSDTQYLRINGENVTLPTGDVAIAGEIFLFIYR